MIIVLTLAILILAVTFFIVFKRCKKGKVKLIYENKNKSEIISRKIEEINKLNSGLIKYRGISSIEKEIENKREELSNLKKETQELNNKFIDAKIIFKELKEKVRLYQNDVEFIELGIYEPIFDIDTSEKYKEKISQIISKQKQLIKDGSACVCETEWVVGNSRKQGEIMTRRYINLTLRAFNGECDALISKVRWNNVKRFEERIRKAFNTINKLGKSNNTFISEEYLDLKVEQLQLTYELAYKKYEEKEEARAIREQQREEERSQREFEKARKEAEIEEKRFQKALERAQKDLGLVSGEELDKLNVQIEQLKKNLKDANEAKERAISRAQQTKSGHVYIISNLGSFGENVFKIGMTRRLDPIDRVKELGDASVPFVFDLHAMIFSDNAPELEKLLHKEFEDKRINKVNYRKEYFNVSLEEIENVVKEKYDDKVEFVKIQKAQQYRETQLIIKQLKDTKEEKIEQIIDEFPDSLF